MPAHLAHVSDGYCTYTWPVTRHGQKPQSIPAPSPLPASLEPQVSSVGRGWSGQPGRDV